MSDLFGIGTSALQAFQRALATTGNNVANVNTPGYSRQRVLLEERPGQFNGAGYVGSGVQVAGIQRLFDALRAAELDDATAGSARLEAFSGIASGLSNLVADEDLGLGAGLTRLTAALEDVATDPTSQPARQALLASLQGAVDMFRRMSTWLESQQQVVAQGLRDGSSSINTLSQGIADLNQRIVSASAGGQSPNDLLDARARLVNQLSELVGVSTVQESNGALDVFVGSGQALVVGADARPLSVARNSLDPERWDLVLGGAAITGQVSGGRLGGLLDAQAELLGPARSEIGRIGATLALRVNEVNGQGLDLDGNAGGALLSAPQAVVRAASANTGSATVSVAYADVGAFRADEYLLAYDGSAWQLRSATTGTAIAMTGSGTPADPFRADGLEFVVGAGAAAGDRYLVQPFAAVARDLAVVESDPRRIAAADAGNTGGTGDNRNALRLAAVMSEGLLDGGRTSLDSANAALVARLGSAAQQATLSSQAQQALLDQASQAMASVSGVNLDEEAANLVRYQQAYQAMSQVIQVADSTFQTLLAALRG
ncbi:MAG: flagellar hook-associated protein FlgK [Steroidobacteraceae bacterium]